MIILVAMSGNKRNPVQATLFGHSPVPKVHKGGRLYDQVLNMFLHINASNHGSTQQLQIAAKAFWTRIKKGGSDGNKDDSKVQQFLKK